MVFASKNAIAHRRNAAVQTSSRWWIYGSMVRIYSLVAAARATRCWISHGWLPQLAGTLTAGFWTWTLRCSPWLWFFQEFSALFFHFFSPPPWLFLSLPSLSSPSVVVIGLPHFHFRLICLRARAYLPFSVTPAFGTPAPHALQGVPPGAESCRLDRLR